MDEMLPVAVIGAGPVGLAAAAHLVGRGLPAKVYEAGASVGANVAAWGHVRTFTPWRYCVDPVAEALLVRAGWSRPPEGDFPTGAELRSRYLEPLAATAPLADVIETGAKVVAISRGGADKVSSRDRAARPFELVVRTAAGERRDPARAVIDASGTWATPNPLGSDGLPAFGEARLGAYVDYGIPDVLGRDRGSYAGRAVLVVGAGDSAANALLDLSRLAGTDPGTSVTWATRGPDLRRVFGGGAADALPARGELGQALQRLLAGGSVATVPEFGIRRLGEAGGRITVTGIRRGAELSIGPFDRIVAATGQRPDLGLTRELRLDLDPWLESARHLGPLIDPNLHSCGSVPPHGHRELAHPEPGFFTVGIKSYGRAPTFLMLTGYEQVRSIVAALAGDLEAADDLRLVLPETGVCSVDRIPEAASAPTCCAPSCCAGRSAEPATAEAGA